VGDIPVKLPTIGLYPNAKQRKYVCVSENSVPLNPMVNDHYPY
jgi:hypothetical protein